MPETAGIQEAKAVVAGLPLATAEIIKFGLIELHPFSALGALFTSQAPAGDQEGQGPA